MALPVNRPSNEITVSCHMADLSTADTAYVVAPVRGRLKRVYSVIKNAITGADAIWTVNINGGTTLASVTVTQSGSAAGDVDSYDIGYMTSTQNYVNEGDYIAFVTDGASSTTCITRFEAVIERSN